MNTKHDGYFMAFTSVALLSIPYTLFFSQIMQGLGRRAKMFNQQFQLNVINISLKFTRLLVTKHSLRTQTGDRRNFL